jgi:hypothetical protein
MMNTKAPLVDAVHSVGPEKVRGRGAARGLPSAMLVRFASGATARLDPQNPRDRTWGEVLSSLREQKEPAYVEIDPETSYITSLLLPQSFGVIALRDSPEEQAIAVDLEISHARHLLQRAHPRFAELHSILDHALRARTRVLVTDALDGSTIIDVRPLPAQGSARRKKSR